TAHPEERLSLSKPRLEGSGRRLQVDLLDPLGPEDRLAARPAGRGRRALADRLEQQTAAVRMEVRQSGGGAEGRGKPRPRSRTDQPLIEKAESGEVRQPVLAEVE